MKIFFFITKSEAGGAQTHVADLTAWLVRHGHTVWVMSAPCGLPSEARRAKDGWLENETKRSGGTFVSNPSLGNTANPFRLFSAAKALKKAVRDFSPDIVACHSTIAGLVGRFTLRNRVPTVFTAHGWSFTQGAKLHRRLILPTLERLAARFCEKIICVSENDLRLAVEKRIAPKEKLMMVHNGVQYAGSLCSASASLGITKNKEIASVNYNLPRNDSADKKIASSPRTDVAPPAVAEAMAGTRNDGFVNIIFIGRLAEPKQPDLLIRALPENARLTIIGDGPDMSRLVELINRLNVQNRITLAGALTREQTIKALANADIFVLPSHYEGIPYSVLEAMAAGVPVIASDVGGVREAVGNDAGILVPPNNPDALKAALARLIADPNLRKNMGEAGRRKAQNAFSLEKMCEKTQQIYLDIARKTA